MIMKIPQSDRYSIYWNPYLSVHFVPYCSHPSLVMPPHVPIVLGKIVRSRLHDRQLGLVLYPPIILRPIHIFPFIASRCALVLGLHQHLLVIDRLRRRNLVKKIEPLHDSIWMVILNHPEVNHPHTTHPQAYVKVSRLNSCTNWSK
jgi:hypothetical protein